MRIVVTDSDGQQFAAEGRIEMLFDGGRLTVFDGDEFIASFAHNAWKRVEREQSTEAQHEGVQATPNL